MQNTHLRSQRQLTGSVQPKRGKFYIVLNLYDTTGKRTPKWIPTGLPIRGNKHNAEKLKQQYIMEYENRIAPTGERILFIEYAKSWLEAKKKVVEVSTWENYENCVTNHIVRFFQNKRLLINEIVPKHIRDYYTYKTSNGRLDGKSGGLSYETLKKHASVLKLIFDDAVEMDIIPKNPSTKVRIGNLREISDQKGRSDNAFLDVDQANILLEKFKGDFLRPLIHTCLYYGLRRSEVLGLKWDAIDFEADTITIKSTVVQHKTIVEKERIKSPKSRATFVLLPEIKEILLQVRSQQSAYKKVVGKNYVDSDYVFTWQDGHMIRPDYITKRFKKVLQNTGLPAMRFHDLRHSCASILYDKGWNVKDIQEWLRHAKLETTMNIYTHISEKKKVLLAKDLENTLPISYGALLKPQNG